jgi:hypothetical protein
VRWVQPYVQDCKRAQLTLHRHDEARSGVVPDHEPRRAHGGAQLPVAVAGAVPVRRAGGDAGAHSLGAAHPGLLLLEAVRVPRRGARPAGRRRSWRRRRRRRRGEGLGDRRGQAGGGGPGARGGHHGRRGQAHLPRHTRGQPGRRGARSRLRRGGGGGEGEGARGRRRRLRAGTAPARSRRRHREPEQRQRDGAGRVIARFLFFFCRRRPGSPLAGAVC